MAKFSAKMGGADHDAYCSAPPFVTTPRPSRAQEAQRPRAPLWVDKPRASEAEDNMRCEVDVFDILDIKPDIKPDLDILTTAAAVARPEATSAASSPDAQRCPLPSISVRWGTTKVTPQPPPVRPRNALLGLQRASAAVATVTAATAAAAAVSNNRQQPLTSNSNRSAAAAVAQQQQRSVSSSI